MKNIDIVDIKSAVKNKEIQFIIQNDGVYCTDIQSKEIVKVADLNLNKLVNINQEGISFGYETIKE